MPEYVSSRCKGAGFISPSADQVHPDSAGYTVTTAADGLDAYTQLKSGTFDLVEGTSLGLSISYGIIQKHKGQIEIRSEAGKGSEMIKIPMAPVKETSDA